MRKHLLLIGFSCTGKTSLGKAAFRGANIIDSDDEILKWVASTYHKSYEHIYQLYMDVGRDQATNQIEQAEESLISKWAADRNPMTISVGPGFPFRSSWSRLRAVSHVVLFRRSPQGIYESLKGRRKAIFEECPLAKNHDNWDVGVIVDERGTEYEPAAAIANISKLLAQRERYYKDHDEEVNTEDKDRATIQLEAIWERVSAESVGDID